MIMKGHMTDTMFSLPIRDWICRVFFSLVSSMAFRVATLLTSGSRQQRISVLNQMPRTSTNHLARQRSAKFGQSSASFSFIRSHSSRFASRNSSHQPLYSGATIGTLSNWRRMNFDGIQQSSFASVFIVFATMSKFLTELHAPNIWRSSTKNLPSHINPERKLDANLFTPTYFPCSTPSPDNKLPLFGAWNRKIKLL
jgi:hypothetical protein